MARVFKHTYTKPLPEGAELFTRKGRRYARFKDTRGKTVTAPLSQDGKKAVIAAGRFDSPPEMLQCQVQTLIRIDGILKGWGHAFSFCNTPQVFVALDDKVDIAIMDFMQMCHSLGQGKTPKQRRRILGVHLLADTPLTPVAIGVE